MISLGSNLSWWFNWGLGHPTVARVLECNPACSVLVVLLGDSTWEGHQPTLGQPGYDTIHLPLYSIDFKTNSSTGNSQAASHSSTVPAPSCRSAVAQSVERPSSGLPSAVQAQRCLTSALEWELVYYILHGMVPGSFAPSFNERIHHNQLLQGQMGNY